MACVDFGARTRGLLQWFRAIPGTTFSDAIELADLRSQEAGRTIIARRDIPAGTTLFTIPRGAVLSVESSDLRHQLRHLFEDHGDQDDDDERGLDSWSALILVLLYEHFRGPASPWKPYLDVLPETFDTPMFWSASELEALRGSPVMPKIGKAEAEEMFRTHIVPAVRKHPGVFRGSENCSEHALIELAHRMGSTIMAYAFDLENEDEDENGVGNGDGDGDDDDGWVVDRDDSILKGMVPMADMMNADAEFNVGSCSPSLILLLEAHDEQAHVHHGDKELTVTSLRVIRAGEEVLNYYGPHANSEMLRRYGFVTEKHARHDYVEVPWSLVKSFVMQSLEGQSQSLMSQVLEKWDDDNIEDDFILERESDDPNADGTLAGPPPPAQLPHGLRKQLARIFKEFSKQDQSRLLDKRQREEHINAILVKTLAHMEEQYRARAPCNASPSSSKPSRRQSMAATVVAGERKLLEEAQASLRAEIERAADRAEALPQKRRRLS